ncbi:hypothetical protein Tco_0795368 [Tanacetum coccineum]
MMALDLTCPSTSQLLWSISLVLARASFAAISKLLSSSGCSEGDYTSSMIPQVYFPQSFSPMFPSTNNQLRTSSNLRNQATIQDGKVTVQQFQERQGQSYARNSYKGNATSLGGNNTGG